ncbi:4256_t:CDS:2 [Cetraspora pellucida]|uniref:4256_t:CDS:1 n=1 Tax=Cetraspora pellucida TaxID=1433469 RepID=A0A9N9EE21_9GLOM|nr:4256_t:CDS:2 [Cetraspora pellucida]
MKSILNFRDVGEPVGANDQNNTEALKKGLLFRSAEPDKATKEDIEQLLNFNIHTIVDLRARKYESQQKSTLTTNFPMVKYPRGDHTNCTIRKTVNINLMERKIRRNYISKTSFYDKLKIIGYLASCQKMNAVRTVYRHLVPRGLTGMYTDWLNFSGDQICKVLELMTDEANLPILIHCKHGKDRTGVIVALVLSICGVEEETIVHEYSVSQVGLASIHTSVVDDFKKLGLAGEFVSAPPDAMRNMLKYIKQKHGSTENYLVGIGFDLDKQKLIRKNFLI